MAWRPSAYLIEGELDNTTPGKVTGWMQFAGMNKRVTFDLDGNFHRDIRGAKIRLKGSGDPDDPAAVKYMEGMAQHQTGEVGDMTTGREPIDYIAYPYYEWFGDTNGRVVLELDADQVEVIGRPIPACESDPISRDRQARNMANFLAGVSKSTGIVAMSPGLGLVSDPSFTHWVVVDGQVIGEARKVEPAHNGTCFAYVRLFNMPECAEHGTVERKHLRDKAHGLPGTFGNDLTSEVQP